VGRTLKELLAPYWPYPTVTPLATTFEAHLAATHRAPLPWPIRSSVKEVVLPFGRFPGADVLLGPEMRSTGEVMSFGASFPEAFAKAQIAASNPLPTSGAVLVSLADGDKREGVSLVARLSDMGFAILATRGTARVLRAMGVPVDEVLKVGEGRPDCVDVIVQGKVSLVVNTPSTIGGSGRQRELALPPTAQERGVPLPWHLARSSGYRIRTAALEHHVPYVTTLVALQATVAAIRYLRTGSLGIGSLDSKCRGLQKVPGTGSDPNPEGGI